MGSSGRQPLFKPGDEVDVKTKINDHHGGWYAAEVESRVRSSFYLVVYKTPPPPAPPTPPPRPRSKRRSGTTTASAAPGFTDTDPTDPADATKAAQPFRVIVHATRMRHRPPPGRRNFPYIVDQPVEAFYRGGWWPGVVAEVHQIQRRVREYSVIVQKTKEAITCRASLMRPLVHIATESQGEGELVKKRRKGIMPQESRKKRRLSIMLASAPGTVINRESVHDHQNNTEPVTQGDTTMKSLNGHRSSNMTVGIIPCSTMHEPSNSQEEHVVVKTSQEAPLIAPKVQITGDSVGDHQDTVLVNKASVEGHSNLRTERVTQQGTSTELLRTLPGTSNSQSQHHEAGTEHEALHATNEALHATIASELMPLPNESHSGVIMRSLVNMPSVDGQSTLGTELLTEPMNHVDMHEFSDMDAEAGKEPAAVISTPRSETAGHSVAPLSGEYQAIQWPFEKCSPMWQYFDTQVMPKMWRQPHFRPLEQSSEVRREGIALGLVVTYENLMNSNGYLKMDSSCRNLDENMKTVIFLEENGFDVQHLRANLEELQRVKRDSEQLLGNKSETEAKAAEIAVKRGHLNAELEETDKAVLALKQALKLFNERKTSLGKQREETETLNAKVHRDLKLTEEELVSLESRLQELLATVRVRGNL